MVLIKVIPVLNSTHQFSVRRSRLDLRLIKCKQHCIEENTSMSPSVAVVGVVAPGEEPGQILVSLLPFNQMFPSAFVQVCFLSAVLTDRELTAEQTRLY